MQADIIRVIFDFSKKFDADPPVYCYLERRLRPFHVDTISEIATILFRLGLWSPVLGMQVHDNDFGNEHCFL